MVAACVPVKLLACAVFALLAALPRLASADGGAFQHALILGGGGEGDGRIYQRIVDLAGGPGKAKIGMITAAADGGRHTAHWKAYERTFKALGAEVHWLPVHDGAGQKAYDPDVVDLASKMNIIFFSGGSQNRLLNNVQDKDGRDTPLLAAIRKNFNARKTIVVGSSAGTASLARGPVITAGESFESLTRPSVPTVDIYNGNDLSYNPRGGLGFFPWAVDTHFSERGREGRFVRFAAETGADLAFGIDEGTAMFMLDPLDPARRTLEVMGPGGVSILDLKGARVKDHDGWSIDDVELSHISEGDVFDPRTRRTRFGRGKAPARRGAPRQALQHITRLQHDVFGSPRQLEVDSEDPAVVSGTKDNSRQNIRVLRHLGFQVARGDATRVDGTAWEPVPPRQRRITVRLDRGRHAMAVETRRGQRQSFRGVRMGVGVRAAAPKGR
jgi:cyanophycinase